MHAHAHTYDTNHSDWYTVEFMFTKGGVWGTLKSIYGLYSKGDIKGKQVKKGALRMKLDLKGKAIF